MFYFYVLQSLKDGELYFGSTRDLRKRIEAHNVGKVFSTRTRKPFRLAYYEAYSAEHDARMREKQIKLRAQAFTALKRRITNCIGKNRF